MVNRILLWPFSETEYICLNMNHTGNSSERWPKVIDFSLHYANVHGGLKYSKTLFGRGVHFK